MDEARKKAETEGKGLLIEFTGSDWCGPCMNLKKDVLSKDEFLAEAQKNFILVELDFPRKALPAEQMQHNTKYGQEYGVRGYPTVLFTDAQGRPIHSFIGGRNMKSVLAEIKTAGERKAKLQEGWKTLETVEGARKFEVIGHILDNVPFDYIDQYYGDLKKELEADDKDISGYRQKSLLIKEKDDLQAHVSQLQKDSGRDLEQVIEGLKKYLGNDALLKETKQDAYEQMANFYFILGNMDQSIESLASAVALDPGTPKAAELSERKDYYATNKDKILLGRQQNETWREFCSKMNDEQQTTPKLYIQSAEAYLKDTDGLLPSVRQSILYQIATAMIADDREEEALKKLQEAYETDPDSREGNGAYILQFKDMIEKSNGALSFRIKAQWDKRRVPAAKIRSVE